MKNSSYIKNMAQQWNHIIRINQPINYSDIETDIWDAIEV